MTVLYILRYWPTRTETFVSAEIAELMRRGVHVVVAAIGSREDGVGLEPVPGLEVWRAPRGLGRVSLAVAARRIRAAFPLEVAQLDRWQRPKDTDRACWVADRAMAYGFDRVHAHFAGEAAEWAALVARVCSCPWSVTVHASDLFRPRPSLPSSLVDARPVLTVCDHHRAVIHRDHGVTAHVVRCGVDPGRFGAASAETVKRQSEVTETLALVSVARWVPKKGLDTLLEALDHVRCPITLHLVADAPRGLGGPRVRVGPEPPESIPGILAQADLFVLPCRVAEDGDRDGVPVALMEAMGAGLPVVTTNVSGIGELVDSEVGWVVPPDDPIALARAIEAASSDPCERVRRGSAGRERIAAGWTLRQQVDGLLAAWDSA